MLMTVADFRSRVEHGLGDLVDELQRITGRRSPEEALAWKTSLLVTSTAFGDPIFQPLHLYFGDRGHLSLEYRLPASSSWCDVVLLGEHAGNAAAAIVELKHWDTTSDRPGPVETLIDRHGRLDLHPSDQVRGYVEYCRYFHSAVQATKAQVHGCVLFTTGLGVDAYHHSPHHELVREFPCFPIGAGSSSAKLVDYFSTRLTKPNASFARQFEEGTYEQDRSFVRNVGETLARATARPLVLLDNQRFGFALAKREIDRAVFESPERGKKIVIVEGPPGSGKSVIAAKVWAALAADPRFPKERFVLTSTSSAQETNWVHLVRTVVGHHGAAGIVMPANRYAPGPLQELAWWKNERPGRLKKPAQWRANLATRLAEKGKPKMPDNHFEVSVVDEAHALINPEHPRAITHSGWPNAFGPQAYHIIRASRVSVFLLDPAQGFRERETTSPTDIERWAMELGADAVTRVSLEGAQFRCGGSTEYVAWVEALLEGRDAGGCFQLARRWLPSERLAAEPEPQEYPSPLAEAARRGNANFEFALCDSPIELEMMLRSKIGAGATARLVASFARPWITDGTAAPHDLPPDEQDFVFRWRDKGRDHVWAKPWNVIQRNDYSYFIQAAPGSRIVADPLAEVGCTYAVRGFDFDYVGLLWLNDLRWSGRQWDVDLAQVFETGVRGTLKSATRRQNPDMKARAEVLERVKQAYRILLTRAIKGVFVFCEDPNTRAHLRAALSA